MTFYCALAWCKTWKKPKSDLEIKACIVLGHTLVKFAHLAQDVLGNFTSAISLYLLSCIILLSLKKILRANPQTKTWILLGNNPGTFGPQLIIWAKREFLEKFHLMNFIKLLSPAMQQRLEKESVQDILDISMQNVMLISSKSWPLTSHRTFQQTSLKS